MKMDRFEILADAKNRAIEAAKNGMPAYVVADYKPGYMVRGIEPDRNEGKIVYVANGNKNYYAAPDYRSVLEHRLVRKNWRAAA